MRVPSSFQSLILAFCLILTSAGFVSADSDVALPTADPVDHGMSQELLDQIPTRLSALVDGKKVPGFVTLVARDGKVVHFEAFGSMDVEREKPMRTDTIFRMYSMTKPVTGAAIMILADRGKIDVSDPVSKYIPEFADMKVLVTNEDGTAEMVPADRPITIHHLLTHTSGLSYGFLGSAVSKYYVESGAESRDLTPAEFAAKAAELPLVAQPGEAWNYSIAMDVLARIIEVVSDQTFGEFLQAEIFGPLDMKDSGFSVPDEDLERFAANYGPTPAKDGMVLLDNPETSSFRTPPGRESGGGGMVGTTTDYFRFAQMLLNGGTLDGTRIISEEGVATMTRQQLGPELGDTPLGTLGSFASSALFKGIGFGYTGAVVFDGVPQTIFGGAGEYSWGGIASTDFWIDKSENIVGLVMTQLLPTGSYPTRQMMHSAAYAAITDSYKN